jgi:hypothetical protein
LHFKDKAIEAAVEKMMMDKGSGFSAFAPSEFFVHLVSTHYMNFFEFDEW